MIALLSLATIALAIAVAILSSRVNNAEEELRQALKFGADNADQIRALKERAGVWPSTPPRAVQTVVPGYME
ncbi:MAG TPA: hypothetical protein VIC02_03835 [Kineobactrum sp.]